MAKVSKKKVSKKRAKVSKKKVSKKKAKVSESDMEVTVE